VDKAYTTPAIRRILVIKWGGMGDVVISTAIMEDIHRAFPHAEIHLNAMRPWEKLFEHDPRFSKVWCVDLRGRERGVRGVWRWIRELRAGRYDLVIDLQTNDRSRWMLTLAQLLGAAPRRMLGNHPVMPYTIRQTPMPPDSHGFAIMRNTLTAAHIPAHTPRPIVYPALRQDEQAQSLLEQHGLRRGEYAVFLPGSHAKGLTKRWGADNYAALASLLFQQGTQQIVLVGGPDESAVCAEISALCPQIVNLCGKTELLQLPHIFRHAQFIVGNDTGTAHLAATSDRPVLVLCGPTDPQRVKPLGDQVTALQADLPCKNCYRKSCGHHSCMKLLTPSRVLAHLPARADA
jgi:heptosyltransferase-2